MNTANWFCLTIIRRIPYGKSVTSLDIKTKIAILLICLILGAMLLIDGVIVATTQRDLLRSEVNKSQLLVELLAGQSEHFIEKLYAGPPQLDGYRIGFGIQSANIAAVMMVNREGQDRWAFADGEPPTEALRVLMKRAISKQALQTQFQGTTWALFWKNSKYLLTACPLSGDDLAAGAVGIILSLEPVFEQLRSSQKMVGFYLLINTCILTFFGLYRLNRLAVRPILRIIRKAEKYRQGDGMFQLEEAGEDELSKLSKALNRVMNLNQDDRQALEETVQQLQDALTKLSNAQRDIIRAEKLASVGRLSAGIAHEIGNPIGIVLGYFELLKQSDLTDSEREDYLARCDEEIDRIRVIIRQMLDCSKPGGGEKKNVSVHSLLNDTIGMVTLQPLFSHLSVIPELTAQNDRVFADPDQLRQMFLNFIINAADALAQDAENPERLLRITTENRRAIPGDNGGSGDLLVVSFSDNGPGISKADLDKIFDPFYTTKSPGKGSGLGLWVALLIAEAIGGKIEVTSQPGEGTQLQLQIPVNNPMNGQ